MQSQLIGLGENSVFIIGLRNIAVIRYIDESSFSEVATTTMSLEQVKEKMGRTRSRDIIRPLFLGSWLKGNSKIQLAGGGLKMELFCLFCILKWDYHSISDTAERGDYCRLGVLMQVRGWGPVLKQRDWPQVGLPTINPQ